MLNFKLRYLKIYNFIKKNQKVPGINKNSYVNRNVKQNNFNIIYFTVIEIFRIQASLLIYTQIY